MMRSTLRWEGGGGKNAGKAFVNQMAPRFPSPETCPRSLGTTSSTVVKLSKGGIRRRSTSQIRDKKGIGRRRKTVKAESVSKNSCFLLSFHAFLPTTNGFCEHCILYQYLYNGQKKGGGWGVGHEGKFLSKPFSALQLAFHLFPKEMSSYKLWINFSISRELETFFAFHYAHTSFTN